MGARTFAWALAAGLALGGAARAQTAGEAAGPPSREPEAGWLFTLQTENEFFIIGPNEDRYYTQGLQLNVLTPSRRMPVADATHTLPFLDPAARYRGGLVWGQNIYTPEDLTLAEPDPRDRPYAGWLYLGGEVITYSTKQLDSLQLQVGLVGPSALGGWAQNNWHKHVNHIPEAQGWAHQLNDEVAFVLYGERRGRPIELWPNFRYEQKHETRHAERANGLSVDVTPDFNFALGTVQSSAGLGATLRVGWRLDSDFGPPRIRPAPMGSSFFGPDGGFSGYAYVGAEAKAVARDIFLDGNTFQDSVHVDKRHVVGELQAGAALRWGPARVTYAYVWRTEEFLGQNGFSEFASVTFSLAPGALLSRFGGR
jgi:hypothetical protein